MAKLKQGFGYIYFLLIVFICVSLVLSLSIITTKNKKMQANNLAKIQAHYYALSAQQYYKKNTALPENNIYQSQLTQEKLLQLPGNTYPMKKGGFKIVKNKESVYFIGYTGSDLANHRALEILKKENNKISKF